MNCTLNDFHISFGPETVIPTKKKTLSSSSSGLVIVNYEHVMTLKTLDLDVLLGGQLNDAQQQQQTPFTSLDKKTTK